MKIVIDIPEDLYEGIERRDGALETEYVCDELMKAIDNGTTLPKGHGRLIDADELRAQAYSQDWYEDIVNGEDIDNASTIIEAESEEIKTS